MKNREVSREQLCRDFEKGQRRGKIMGGLLVVAAGSLFLARELGAQIPAWMFTWKALLIGLGIVLAVKHKFMHPGWLILVAVGGTFLLGDLYPDLQIRAYVWPVVLILVGLLIVFKPRRKFHPLHAHYLEKWKAHRDSYRYNDAPGHYKAQPWEAPAGDEEYVESVNILGGVKKNVLSKKFTGGDVVNVFGGAHLDLSKADFEGSVTLSITQVFGGTKLIVPANWEVKSDTIAVCGGIDDKRPVSTTVNDDNKKILRLIGTTVCGGIEIKSY